MSLLLRHGKGVAALVQRRGFHSSGRARRVTNAFEEVPPPPPPPHQPRRAHIYGGGIFLAVSGVLLYAREASNLDENLNTCCPQTMMKRPQSKE